MKIAKKLLLPIYYSSYPTIDKWLWNEGGCHLIMESSSTLRYRFYWLKINTL